MICFFKESSWIGTKFANRLIYQYNSYPLTNRGEIVLNKLQSTGQITEVENFFKKPSDWGYRGINTKVKLQDKSIAELQIHTPQSLNAAKKVRRLYEKWRDLDSKQLTISQLAQKEKDRLKSIMISEKEINRVIPSLKVQPAVHP